MNYIRHLNAFFSFVRSDTRLTSSHVSLYIALFSYWNFNRFQNPFSIYRENVMQLSKLSKNTYHKCLKELHEAKYIYYHPSPSKFQAVRISIIRLDREEEKSLAYTQLDLFDGRKIETDSVANLSQTSPNIKTDTVSNLGHSYKPNINKQRETPAHEIFKRNRKIQNTINDLGGVSNLIHIPPQQEVEDYFSEQKHPSEEAIKFFNHYKALEWRLQGRTPILNWKPLAEKWMQNSKKWDEKKRQATIGPAKDIQYLYDSFLQGNKIFKYITPEHFDQLNLELTDETLQNARNERVNQVSGTNQHSLNDLWQAYLKNDSNNPLLLNDKPNLIALAKKIAVIKHFHNLKNRST